VASLAYAKVRVRIVNLDQGREMFGGERKLNPLISWLAAAGALLAGDRLLDGVQVVDVVTALVARWFSGSSTC
jgi:hypothetical protein